MRVTSIERDLPLIAIEAAAISSFEVLMSIFDSQPKADIEGDGGLFEVAGDTLVIVSQADRITYFNK